jgi:hypothetical protein
MKHRRILGIDAGLSSGAAAVYGYDGSARLPALLAVTDLPTRGEGTAKRIDVTAFRHWLMQHDVSFAYIENANAMPAIPDATGFRRPMGGGTMARYLRAAGATEACVELCGIDWASVQPGVWKKALGLAGPNKGNSVDLARQLFPERAATWFKFKKSHNIAESSLLALYGAARCDLVELKWPDKT